MIALQVEITRSMRVTEICVKRSSHRSALALGLSLVILANSLSDLSIGSVSSQIFEDVTFAKEAIVL
jgi:hypothetical protein